MIRAASCDPDFGKEEAFLPVARFELTETTPPEEFVLHASVSARGSKVATSRLVEGFVAVRVLNEKFLREADKDGYIATDVLELSGGGIDEGSIVLLDGTAMEGVVLDSRTIECELPEWLSAGEYEVVVESPEGYRTNRLKIRLYSLEELKLEELAQKSKELEDYYIGEGFEDIANFLAKSVEGFEKWNANIVSGRPFLAFDGYDVAAANLVEAGVVASEHGVRTVALGNLITNAILAGVQLRGPIFQIIGKTPESMKKGTPWCSEEFGNKLDSKDEKELKQALEGWFKKLCEEGELDGVKGER